MGVRQIFQCDSGGEVHTSVKPPVDWIPLTVSYIDPMVGVNRVEQFMICPNCWGTDKETKLSDMLSNDPRRQQMLDDMLAAEFDRMERIRKLSEKADEEK